MINSFFFKYNYLGIIQEYFQPKKKIGIFSLGQENNILIKKERGCIKLKKTYLLLAALKLKDSVLFLNTFYSFQVD